MKVLFFTSFNADNLEDGCLHGLRSLLGPDCVEFPKKEIMYKGWTAKPHTEMYGNMFTLWRLLDDIPVDRLDIDAKLKNGFFDLVIFGSIHRTLMYFRHFEHFLPTNKTILLDGEDRPPLAPYPRKYLCFKRELTAKATYYYTHKMIPKRIASGRLVRYHPNLLPISFSIPKEKITLGIDRSEKEKLLPLHITDDELRNHQRVEAVLGKKTGPRLVFSEEKEYYHDLAASKFGITMERGGWDCLRHYEIAANGAVMCFKHLDDKYPLCAPHGLDRTNSISYRNPEDLFRTIDAMSDVEYDRLLENGYKWIARQTTEVRARELLDRARAMVRT